MAGVERLEFVGCEGEMELTFAEIVRLGAILEPGQLEGEVGASVTEVDELEGAVLRIFLSDRSQIQSLLIEGDAFFKIKNIKVKVIESDHSDNVSFPVFPFIGNLDVIKVADYIIDMGPDGGDRGGTVVVAGTPEQVAEHPTSYTGKYVKQMLERQ